MTNGNLNFHKYTPASLVCIAMLMLSLLPEINLWIVRGRAWNGAYVSATGDEPIYSAYLNALIAGRARKNDPFAGQESTAKSPLPESSFSIQFIPPLVISFLARVFGASASTAMIALVGATGLFASLSVFWLLNNVVGDSRKAAVGTLFVLCLGGLAGRSGIVGILLGNDMAIPGLPFLRAYQPAAPFPLFFVFNLLVWRALTNLDRRKVKVATVFAGLTLAVLIFSYVYLWTAAATWLACIAALWLCFRPIDRHKVLSVLMTITIIASIALVPYVYFLSRRSPTLDQMQALVSTHELELFWLPEILGALVLALLIFLTWRRRVERTSPQALFAASFGLLPFVLFNQQLLTGKSLQPQHFANFVANYTVVLSAVVGFTLLRKNVSPRLLVWMGALFFSWGLLEVGLTARFASVPLAITRDRMIPTFLRLRELSYADGTMTVLGTPGSTAAVVFSPNLGVSGMLPTWTLQGTLLDLRGLDFGTATLADRKERFFIHLYYCKADSQFLENALQRRSTDFPMNFYALSTMFPYDRILAGLTSKYEPIRSGEIEPEVRSYQAFIDSFSREEALKRPITYAVIPADDSFDFSNLDRWYERDAGERVGDYVLYRLKLRP